MIDSDREGKNEEVEEHCRKVNRNLLDEEQVSVVPDGVRYVYGEGTVETAVLVTSFLKIKHVKSKS